MIGVSESGIYFFKLSYLGKFKSMDFFRFDEIEKINFGVLRYH